MSIADLAYNSTHIVGFRPTVAPNPSCCSNPAVLCVSCAAEALLAANEQGLVLNAGFEGSIPQDTDAISQMTEEQEAEYERNKENLRRLSLSDDDADILLPPGTMEAVTNARLQELSSNNTEADEGTDDMLQLPRLFG